MTQIVLQAFISLDGVVQAPGGAGEDPSGGFANEGWSRDFDARFGGEDGNVVAEWESRTEGLLLGRKTYDIFSASWGVWDENAEGFQGELTRRYNRIPKYVASRTLTGLGWKNSHLLGSDVPGAVRKLREQEGGEIRVWGSSDLFRTLRAHDLVDEYRLLVYPLVLGGGKRLFSDGFAASRLRLAESTPLPSGVVVNVYRRTEG
ncbi:MAG: dihydrofolate reductase family protein [Actinomycetota bacterium]